jgi:DNA-binding winged helix-turn-helix (wHTH) protein
MIENRGRLVTKDELVENIWDGRFITDTAISTLIKTARRVIDDDGKAQRLIRTVHGRGFRFIGIVD